jgi:hypothetical protein
MRWPRELATPPSHNAWTSLRRGPPHSQHRPPDLSCFRVNHCPFARLLHCSQGKAPFGQVGFSSFIPHSIPSTLARHLSCYLDIWRPAL